MFGFGKKDRAEKALRSALGIFVPANKQLKTDIMAASSQQTSDAINHIAEGENPYRLAALLVAVYIRSRLESNSEEEKRKILVMISEKKYPNQKVSFLLTAHMLNTIAILQQGDDPLLPVSTMHEFLDHIAGTFSDQPGAKKHIESYFIEYARRNSAAADPTAENAAE